jgi:hypothetical protein
MGATCGGYDVADTDITNRAPLTVKEALTHTVANVANPSILVASVHGATPVTIQATHPVTIKVPPTIASAPLTPVPTTSVLTLEQAVMRDLGAAVATEEAAVPVHVGLPQAPSPEVPQSVTIPGILRVPMPRMFGARAQTINDFPVVFTNFTPPWAGERLPASGMWTEGMLLQAVPPGQVVEEKKCAVKIPTEEELAAAIYNETGRLRPNLRDPSGPVAESNYDRNSMEALAGGRELLGHVVVNLWAKCFSKTSRCPSSKMPSDEEMTHESVKKAWALCLAAARAVLADRNEGQDPTKGALNFYLRSGGANENGIPKDQPWWAKGKKPAITTAAVRCLGGGGGDVPAGNDVHFDIYRDIP